jgi:hypothetical protein
MKSSAAEEFRKNSMPFLWRVLVFLSLFQIGAFEVSAKQNKEEPIPVPPTPVSERVQGYVKEPLKITLRASGRIEEPMDFLIRKLPRKGSLGELRRTGPKSAMVVYTPAADAGPEQDSFTFAARSVDSPVSAPARIDIDLLHRPAALEFPQSVDFGVVPIGDTVRLEVCIKNTGGSDAPLAISVNPPWSLEGPPPNEIKAGGESLISLIFAPETFGSFSERFTLSASGKQFISLKGSSQEPFQWPAQGLVIPSESRQQADLSIQISNLTDKSRELDFQWPSGIVAPSRINIPASSAVPVPVALEPSTPPAFSFFGEVTFRSGNFTGAFPLAVRPAPARLVFEPSDIVHLSETSVYDTAVGTLVVKNTGGLPTPLKIEIPDALSIRPEPSGVLVNPNDSVEFEIFAKSATPGNYSFDLKIGAADGPIQPLKVLHSVRPSQPVEKLLDFRDAPPVNSEPAGPVGAIPVKECFLDESTPHSVTIHWKLTSPETKGFLVERRVIRAGLNGRPDQKWEPFRQAEIKITGDIATAYFRKLPPGTFWNIRLRGIDSEGLVGPPPTGHFRIETRPINPWKIPFWIWIPALLAITAGIFLIVKKRIRFVSESNPEERITEP